MCSPLSGSLLIWAGWLADKNTRDPSDGSAVFWLLACPLFTWSLARRWRASTIDSYWAYRWFWLVSTRQRAKLSTRYPLLTATVLFCKYLKIKLNINSEIGTGTLLGVRVSNCSSFPCFLKRGTRTTVEFDFIPSMKSYCSMRMFCYSLILGASTITVSTGASAKIGPVRLPFVGVNGSPACSKITLKSSRESVGCVLNPNEVYTYSNTFDIHSYYPPVRWIIPVKWFISCNNNQWFFPDKCTCAVGAEWQQPEERSEENCVLPSSGQDYITSSYQILSLFYRYNVL